MISASYGQSLECNFYCNHSIDRDNRHTEKVFISISIGGWGIVDKSGQQ